MAFLRRGGHGGRFSVGSGGRVGRFFDFGDGAVDVRGPEREKSAACCQYAFQRGSEGLGSNRGDGSSVIDCIAGGVMD